MITQATFEAALKELYGDDIPLDSYIFHKHARTNTFLFLVEKDTEGGGEGWSVPLEALSMAGASASFSEAQGHTGDNERWKFKGGWCREYAIGHVDRLTQMATKNKAHAIIEATKRGMDSAMARCNERLAAAVWGDGSGAIGRIAEVLSGSRVRLEEADDIVKVRQQARLQSNPTRRGSMGTMRGGLNARCVVTARDAESGIFTYSAEGGWTAVVGDYLYAAGDYDAKIAGILGWIPPTKPTAGDSWLGIDRSVDPSTLAGLRYDASAETSHKKALINAMGYWYREGVQPTHVFCHPTDFTAYENELEDKRDIVELKVEGYEIGIKAIRLSNGALLTQDTYAVKGYAWPLDMGTWKLISVGKLPEVFKNPDTGGYLRTRDGSDSSEFRIGGYGNLKCEDPHRNGVVKMPPS